MLLNSLTVHPKCNQQSVLTFQDRHGQPIDAAKRQKIIFLREIQTSFCVG